MRYGEVRVCDINNGPGLMVTLWTQGCDIKCKGCHNPHLQDFDGGKEYTESTQKYILKELDSIQNLGILGGEPLSPINIPVLTNLVKEVKSNYPTKEIWVWTGYLFEDVQHYELINYIDVLIDGRFDSSKASSSIRWRGSYNQRVINVPRTLESGVVIELNVDKRGQ